MKYRIGEKTMFGLGFWELLIVLMFGGLFFVLPFWKIFSKAGFSGWWSLTQPIPLLNVIVLFYLAFAESPVRR